MATLTLILDRESYPLGSFLKFRLIGEASAEDCTASVYRQGESRPVLVNSLKLQRLPNGFQELWEIPADAPTGRYQVRLVISNALPPLEASFSLFRREITIDAFNAGQRFYSAGDPISFELKLTNHTGTIRKRLRVSVGEAQYPWIRAARGEREPENFVFSEALDLAPGETRTLTIHGQTRCGEHSGSVQYTATVESGSSGQIAAFRSTPPVFIRCPEQEKRPVYPATYIHSDLSQVRTGGYRQFYNEPLASGTFDLAHTTFRANQPNQIDLQPPLDQPGIRILLELRSKEGAFVDEAQAHRHQDRLRAVLRFAQPGLYTLRAHFLAPGGDPLRTESIQVSANDLPHSIAVVCAHPDDEFLHPAAIRAAVENGIPVDIIYLTCGDAGGSDRFFGTDYTPAEAIEFGHIRMAEARAAAAHLGIPASRLHFLGLPDGFLENIRQETNGRTPVFSPLLGTDHAPYRDTAQPNLRYQKLAVVQALANLLAAIQPAAVYTSHPDERHADHKAAALFTIEALQSLLAAKRLERLPVIRTDQFYGAAAGEPEPFQYRSHEFYASGESMARVQEAYWFYQSQGGNHARGHVLSYADLPRIEYHQEVLDWAQPAKLPLPAAV
ncbi:MAG TPA: PIG-L family deacetylase [Bryobacteraceae bacterium]|jgi:LmbE family N-acetylglucosaminyl deacetylase|nr:PIG-L family deacetylase [Bryobacteraceae bacterium]